MVFQRIIFPKYYDSKILKHRYLKKKCGIFVEFWQYFGISGKLSSRFYVKFVCSLSSSQSQETDNTANQLKLEASMPSRFLLLIGQESGGMFFNQSISVET